MISSEAVLPADSLLDQEETIDLNFLIDRYKNTNINIETGDEALWKVTFHLDKQTVVVGIDVNISKNKVPQARILEPKLTQDSSVLWNGVLVLEELTAATWTGGDFIEKIQNYLSGDLMRTAAQYEAIALKPTFQRVGPASDSFLPPFHLICEEDNCATHDQIVLSSLVKDHILEQIKHSEHWFLEREQLYFELETKSGLKMIASLSSTTHEKQDNIVLLSKTTAQNLDSEHELVTIRLVGLPVAKKLELWIPDNMFSLLPSTKNKILAVLEGYTSFTAGSLLHFFDTEFNTERTIAVIGLETWNTVEGLNLEAATKRIEGNADAEMLITYSKLKANPVYKNVNPLRILSELER